mmetsp:Transcript_26194/g.62301  ORF Transcript_26194/g.62301 Transcript_26194/m.62301 type:complete len:303 (+) Transcript_26194:608-1516(+)
MPLRPRGHGALQSEQAEGAAQGRSRARPGECSRSARGAIPRRAGRRSSAWRALCPAQAWPPRGAVSSPLLSRSGAREADRDAARPPRSRPARPLWRRPSCRPLCSTGQAPRPGARCCSPWRGSGPGRRPPLHRPTARREPSSSPLAPRTCPGPLCRASGRGRRRRLRSGGSEASPRPGGGLRRGGCGRAAAPSGRPSPRCAGKSRSCPSAPPPCRGRSGLRPEPPRRAPSRASSRASWRPARRRRQRGRPAAPSGCNRGRPAHKPAPRGAQPRRTCGRRRPLPRCCLRLHTKAFRLGRDLNP